MLIKPYGRWNRDMTGLDDERLTRSAYENVQRIRAPEYPSFQNIDPEHSGAESRSASSPDWRRCSCVGLDNGPK